MTTTVFQRACPVCGLPAPVTERFLPASLCECVGCGLLFRTADPGEDAARRLYSDDRYAAERMTAHTRHRDHDADMRARWTRANVSGDRLLEIGAGTGFFVARAARYGFAAIGIEPSGLAAEFARTQLQCDVRTGFLDSGVLMEGGFDVACMWHVLEHAVDPLALLREVHGRLRIGGSLVIEVPNIESVGARVFGGRWAHLDPGAHVCHFNTRSLSLALAATGFDIVDQQTLLEGYYDRFAMRIRPRRLAGRVVRAMSLRTLRTTHPTRGELLRVLAVAGAQARP